MDKRAKHWMLTLFKNDINEDKLKEHIIEKATYGIYCKEKGENQEHLQVYIAYNYQVRFSTLKNEFPESHFEIKRGTVSQAIEYIKKEGPHTDKKHTQIGEIWEYGEIPTEERTRTDLVQLQEDMESGDYTYDEIMMKYPGLFLRYEQSLSKMFDKYRTKFFKENWRHLEVTYVTGATGTGKTRTVMETFGYQNVYRVSDYKHPWDMYDGQDVVIFEEFRSQLPISDMLNYLDGYPLTLPARYFNKQACFTKVFIITNWDLDFQYQNVDTNSFEAFKRRINIGCMRIEDFKPYMKKRYNQI